MAWRLVRPRPLYGRIALIVVVISAATYFYWDDFFEKRIAVVVPGKIVRGAWQRPGPLKAIVVREKIRTIISLTAINQDDPKYVDQANVVKLTGVTWLFVPMRGSRATLQQMAESADLLADPALQPVFFHCVAGHHRSSLAHAAYRIRHEFWSAERAWAEVSSLAWARPKLDTEDRRLIEAFAASEFAEVRPGRYQDEVRSDPQVVLAPALSLSGNGRNARELEFPHGQLRDHR